MLSKTDGDTKNAQTMSQNVKKLVAPREVLGEDYKQITPVELSNSDSTLDSLLPRTYRKLRANDLNCKF